jgi:hypothetical protein
VPIEALIVNVLIAIEFFAIALGAVYVFSDRSKRLPADPEWEAKWISLPVHERRRLEVAAQRGHSSDDPEEAALIAGSAHVQRVRWSRRDVSELPFVVVGLLTVITGLVEGSPTAWIIGLCFAGAGVYCTYQRRAVATRLAALDDRAQIEAPGRQIG